MNPSSSTPLRLVKTTDWTQWVAPIQATLVFLIQDNQVLLIHKKTGLGQGKVNAPGGKREGSESFLECMFKSNIDLRHQNEFCTLIRTLFEAGE